MPQRRPKSGSIAEPDLPELEPFELTDVLDAGAFVAEGAAIELDRSERIDVRRIRISESMVQGFTVAQGRPELRIDDAVLRNCDLSNVDGGEGSLRRVEITNSKMIGFSLASGQAHDLRVTDTSLSLASFGFAELRNVAFEGVDLREASFQEATLERVAFVGCELAGTDFRRAVMRDCTIRGSSLDGIIGLESLRGVTMPWSDVVASAGALAEALGINVAED